MTLIERWWNIQKLNLFKRVRRRKKKKITSKGNKIWNAFVKFGLKITIIIFFLFLIVDRVRNENNNSNINMKSSNKQYSKKKFNNELLLMVFFICLLMLVKLTIFKKKQNLTTHHSAVIMQFTRTHYHRIRSFIWLLFCMLPDFCSFSFSNLFVFVYFCEWNHSCMFKKRFVAHHFKRPSHNQSNNNP